MLKQIKKFGIVLLAIAIMAVIAFTSNMVGKNTQPIFNSSLAQIEK